MNNRDGRQHEQRRNHQHHQYRDRSSAPSRGPAPAAGTEYEGVIAVTRKGVGYFSHETLPEDLEIDPGKLNCALNGDTVIVKVAGYSPRGRLQGEVAKVVARATTQFVGTLVEENGFLILHPDNQRVYIHIRIPESGRTPEAKEGYKALVALDAWTDPLSPPMGRVIRVLGPAGLHETEMQATLAAHGFVPAFPPAVEREAEAIAARGAVSAADYAERRDFRDILTFTIDPTDAKDFDDALSFQALGDGACEVGIHIADVTNYVRPGTALDAEARHRATSVYLVDRTIPMLPEALSNNLCSLVPHEERLAFSAVFTVAHDGQVTERWFGKSVIRSAHRFTYESAQESLDGKSDVHREALAELDRLAQILRQERTANGAISFETDEVRFELDADGKPIRVYVKERLETMRMIEDWMLLANKEVAEFISRKAHEDRASGKATDETFIYRIHDEPDTDRIEDLKIFLHAIGHDLGHKDAASITGRDVNRLLAEVRGTPEEAVVQMATLRSMAKAVYSHKNVGHFSLGFKHYTHFTSPIRRYPDMMVHRILESHLHGEPLSAHELESYRTAAIHSSEREVEAVAAERDSVKYKQVEFMLGKIGQEFDGVITGVGEHGVFVAEKESRAEGMAHVSTLGNDYFELDRKHYSMVGRSSGKKFRLGDAVRIKLLAADLESRQLDWGIVS
ncbi:MAG TPA: ribonuclease R [Candidatus Paceibacterota bacterium]|nr:ribonuclease R [Candidatus Paceibacterota bacterium]